MIAKAAILGARGEMAMIRNLRLHCEGEVQSLDRIAGAVSSAEEELGQVRSKSSMSCLSFIDKRYTMIRSFSCPDTQALYEGKRVARFANIQGVAERKLTMLNSAKLLQDLKSPPGNRLHQLVGGRAGQYSIRINDQWRICFVWTDDGPEDVEIVDYH